MSQGQSQRQSQGQGRQTEAQRTALLNAADELNNLVRLWDAKSFVWYAGIDAGDMTQIHPVLTLLLTPSERTSGSPPI